MNQQLIYIIYWHCEYRYRYIITDSSDANGCSTIISLSTRTCYQNFKLLMKNNPFNSFSYRYVVLKAVVFTMETNNNVLILSFVFEIIIVLGTWKCRAIISLMGLIFKQTAVIHLFLYNYCARLTCITIIFFKRTDWYCDLFHGPSIFPIFYRTRAKYKLKTDHNFLHATL